MAAPVTEKILGIDFWNDSADAAVEYMSTSGGFLVAPSGTCFERLLEDPEYRTAITSADVALVDSGLVASLWRVLQRRSLRRVSGLLYLRTLMARNDLRTAGKVLWILPHARSRDRLIGWGRGQGVPIEPANCYLAPMYGRDLDDEALLDLIRAQRPAHIIIGIGAGAQERLGYHLREQLPYRPAIHCIGGALGLMTGDQVSVPALADRLYLGWVVRLVSQPRVFIPRLKKARLLPMLIARYGSELPPLRPRGSANAAE